MRSFKHKGTFGSHPAAPSEKPPRPLSSASSSRSSGAWKTTFHAQTINVRYYRTVMETNKLGHCHQTDPFDLTETHREFGTITIVSSSIELGYMHGMACHLRSRTTSWLWRLGTYYVNCPKGSRFSGSGISGRRGLKKLRRPPEATLPSAGPRGGALGSARSRSGARRFGQRRPKIICCTPWPH